ncbi:MAG: Crp/Fnr family transcriptional regulator [Parvularculaceae bacterium]|jgi:CRP-like cAMP-binding protein|nr:Crp/Fnr family transcriptional regulator [Parvularculaceae bacterium]
MKTDADAEFKIRLLRASPVLKAAADDDLVELARVGKVGAFQAGKVLQKPENAPQVLVLQSGVAAELVIERGVDDAILVGMYGPGAIFGLVGALAPKRSTPKEEIDHAAEGRRIEALTNLQVYSAPAADFFRIARRNPDLSIALLSLLADQHDRLARQYARSTSHSLEVRLAAFFAEVADLIAPDDWNPSANLGKLSQSSVASMLGVSREHVNRTLAIWERSGIIFQNKKGEILVQNARRLERLAESKPERASGDRSDDWLWEIDAHLDRGLNQAAAHLALESARRSPKDMRYMHRAVLATARMGAISEALALLDKHKLGRDLSDEELACLRPRLLRDLAFADRKGQPDSKRLLLSAREYEKVFEKTGGFYPGVNAAAGYALAGDRHKARALAAAVSQLLTRGDAEAESDYWRRTTLAECKLIEGDKAAAASLFEAAACAEDTTPGKRATTRKQLLRLAPSVGVDRSWIDRAAPQADVAFFCGPIAREGHGGEAAPIDRMIEDLEEFLQDRRIGWAYGALASGADIAIAERLLEEGVELYVYLPLAPQDFLKASVQIGGAAWRDRFINCMRRASSIEWNRRTPIACNSTYRLGAEIAMGKAVRHASQLETAAVGYFAAPDDRDASVSLSLSNAELWKARGLPARLHRDRWPAPPNGQAAAKDIATLYFALIIENGVRLPKSLSSVGDFRFKDSEGELDIMLFKSLETALEAAEPLIAEAQGGAWCAWLDAGVFPAQTLQAKNDDAVAQLITAACRPQTEAGKVYASDAFACAAAMRNVGASFEYVGFAPTREKLDPCAMYLATL